MSMTGLPVLCGRRCLMVLAALAVSSCCVAIAGEGVPVAGITLESRDITVVEGDDIAFGRVESTQEFPRRRVGQIAQDDTGFIWFGTQYALYRFDGYSHMAFAGDPSVRTQLGGVFVHAIRGDSSGRLWISTEQGLDIF